MVRPKQFSGKDVVKILVEHGFEVRRKVGSHVRLTLTQENGSSHITIPLHDVLKKGTLHGIMKDFELCFGKSETIRCFF